MKRRIEVYQVEDQVFGLKQLEMISKQIEINPADYHKTFETIKNAECDVYELLEQLFHELNADDRPTRYTSRSLSVSDVVMVEDQAFLCMHFGWKPIRFRVKEIISL